MTPNTILNFDLRYFSPLFNKCISCKFALKKDGSGKWVWVIFSVFLEYPCKKIIEPYISHTY